MIKKEELNVFAEEYRKHKGWESFININIHIPQCIFLTWFQSMGIKIWTFLLHEYWLILIANIVWVDFTLSNKWQDTADTHFHVHVITNIHTHAKWVNELLSIL